MTPHGGALEATTQETCLGRRGKTHLSLQILTLVFGQVLFYSPLVLSFWITFMRVIFVLMLLAKFLFVEKLGLGAVLSIINRTFEVLLRFSPNIENVLVDLQRLWCSLAEAHIETGYASRQLFLAGNVFLLFIVELLHSWALIDAVRLHVELLHIYCFVWNV